MVQVCHLRQVGARVMGNLDPVCVGLLVARTMTRLASVILFYTFCQGYSYTYMSSLEPTLPLCSSGRQIAL